MKKKREGYMTIEAAVIVPLAIYVTVALIYLGMFLYNQCFSNQNCYLVALQTTQQRNLSEQELKQFARRNVQERFAGQLLFTSTESPEVKITLLEVDISYVSKIKSSLKALEIFGAQEFEVRTGHSAKRVNPTQHIRMCHRFK